jgi:hypothetical protein
MDHDPERVARVPGLTARPEIARRNPRDRVARQTVSINVADERIGAVATKGDSLLE